jgi:hypothetical protein
MSALLVSTAASPKSGASGAQPSVSAPGQEAPAGSQPRTSLSPHRLAIYYGIPSLVNGVQGDVGRAAAVFGEYDVVVFGDGLEFSDVVPSRTPPGAGGAERLRTAGVIRALSKVGRRPSVFGYIDLGRSQHLTAREIERRIALWQEIGAHGIFLDEAGYDFGVDRPRQNAAVDAAHAMGLRVFVNAFNPDDVFLPSSGQRSHLEAGDAYLLESFAVRNGRVDDHGWTTRAARAVAHARPLGVAVHAVTTTVAASDASSALIAYAWWAALAFGIDGFGWGEPAFSGPDSVLPWRVRPEGIPVGERFVGPAGLQDGVYTRPTNHGRIEIDMTRHTGRFVLSPGRSR